MFIQVYSPTHLEGQFELDKITFNKGFVQTYTDEYGFTLRKYTEILAGYSGNIRLTGPGDAETLWSDHVIDCLYSLPFLPGKGKVIDVGTGGGFPGIVWAICRPDLNVFLLDSVRKKCTALKDIAKELSLSNITVIWSRSEDYAATEKESFDVACARALSDTGTLAEYLTPLVRTGGIVLAFKGPRVHEELAHVKNKWQILGLDEPSIYPYVINEKKHFIVRWNKKKPCSPRFPRRPGVAERKPWWR